MHIERSTRCMDVEMQRHPGERRDPDPGGRLDSRVRGNDPYSYERCLLTLQNITRSRQMLSAYARTQAGSTAQKTTLDVSPGMTYGNTYSCEFGSMTEDMSGGT